MTERVCVIHIGTHKTGTTSQQNFLAYNREELLRHGILYVSAGWFQGMTGNHQIPWELLTSDLSPSLNSAVHELRSSHAHTAIMSSEEFSLLYAHPHAIRILADAVRSAGFTPKFLVYLRAQPPYAESHYVERVKHRYVVSVDAFVREILETGLYHQPNTETRLEFDYPRQLAPFAEVVGRENVMARTFGVSREVAHVFSDFMQAVTELSPRVAEAPFQLRVQKARENESLSFYQLLATIHMAMVPDEVERFNADPQAFCSIYAPGVSMELLTAKYALLSRAEWLRFLERFGPSNAIVEAEYGTHIPFQQPSDVPEAGDRRWAIADLERRTLERCIAQWARRTA